MYRFGMKKKAEEVRANDSGSEDEGILILGVGRNYEINRKNRKQNLVRNPQKKNKERKRVAYEVRGEVRCIGFAV